MEKICDIAEAIMNITDNDVRKFLDESYYKKMYEDDLPF